MSKSAGCFCREPQFSSQHRLLTTACNSGSKNQMPSSGLTTYTHLFFFYYFLFLFFVF